MLQNKPRKRYIWGDITRSLAIFFIVLIHTTPKLNHATPLDWLIGIFYLSASVSISLFIMLSGAFLLNKQEKYTDFFRKRLIKIIIPWIGWTAIWTVWATYTQNIHFLSFASIKAFVYTELFSRFWFIPLIVSLYLFTPILRVFIQKAKNRDLLYLLTLWTIFVIILPVVKMTFGLNLPLPSIINSPIIQFLGIYVFGYFIIFRYKAGSVTPWILLAAAGIIMAYFELLVFPTQTAYRFNHFPYNFISPEILLSSVGLLMTIYIFFNKKRLLLPKKLTELIHSVGKMTLGIYLAHEFFMELVHRLSIDSIFPIGATITVFIMSFLAVSILKKIPLLKILVP